MISTQTEFKVAVRKNDVVQVIAGKEKGKSGKVLKVDSKHGRVTVEKINMVKKHVRPSQKFPQGGILEKELPVHHSNVLLMCPKCNRGVRYGHRMVEKAGKKGAKATQKKVRVCKRCDESLDAA